jgi:TetR/AcrR family transcriptional repressor of nem operon
MRVSREEAENNRKRVVNVAGQLFREHGFDGIGIADLMKQAGLTHGGFYKQFGSKADLEAEASACIMEENADLWSGIIARQSEDQLAGLLAFYLSERQLDAERVGCGMATLGGDAARQGTAVQAAFTDGIKRHLQQLSEIVRGGDQKEKRRNAMATLAGMVGALLLARAVDDRRFAAELLETTRSDLADRFGD